MIELYISLQGIVRLLYSDEFPVQTLGPAQITRASHVEPDKAGRWWADLAAVAGPRLGPFALRQLALAAGQEWLTSHILTTSHHLETRELKYHDDSVSPTTLAPPSPIHRLPSRLPPASHEASVDRADLAG